MQSHDPCPVQGFPAGHAFAWIEVVQMGQDHQLVRDDYVYSYSPYGPRSEQLNLARVLRERIAYWRATTASSSRRGRSGSSGVRGTAAL